MSMQPPPPPPGFPTPPPPSGYPTPPSVPQYSPPYPPVAPPTPGWQPGPPPGWAPAPSSGPNPGSLAGFWIRFAGWLIDSFLYGLLAAVFVIPGIVLIVQAFNDCVTFEDEVFCPPGAPEPGFIAGGIALILAGLALVLVIFIRALGKTGQTWGSRIVGIKVVGELTGQPIGVSRAIGRQLFAWLVSAQIFYLGYIWMAWDDENQTWQDKIIKSVVIKT